MANTEGQISKLNGNKWPFSSSVIEAAHLETTK